MWRRARVEQPKEAVQEAKADFMWRTAPMRSNATRAFWDTLDNLWFDVKLGSVFTLVFAALSYQQGLPVARVTLLSLIAWVAILSLVYLWNLARVARDPERGHGWVLGQNEVWKNQDPILRFSIELTEPMYVGRNACEVTCPDRTVWMEHNRDEQPKAVRGLGVYYPRDFPGSPSVTSGTYGVRWLIGRGSKGRWREILRYDVPVDLS